MTPKPLGAWNLIYEHQLRNLVKQQLTKANERDEQSDTGSDSHYQRLWHGTR
jgi:hypothetical protein